MFYPFSAGVLTERINVSLTLTLKSAAIPFPLVCSFNTYLKFLLKITHIK